MFITVTTILTLSIGILGAVLGSFIGVIAERVHTGQSWKSGRSRCNSCREFLGARDLIPVLSWVIHQGRCRRCGSRVPGAYALYELALGVAFAAAYVQYGISLPLAFLLISLCILAFITIYDLRHTIVPLTASALLVVSSALFSYVSYARTGEFLMALFYAVGIALFFFLLYALSKGRAMGLGDTPVSFALALIAGPLAIAGFLFSFWIGGVIGMCILAFRRGGPRMGIEVPFVPFMALGFLLALFTQWNPLPF